jgi:hypothetical protein
MCLDYYLRQCEASVLVVGAELGEFVDEMNLTLLLGWRVNPIRIHYYKRALFSLVGKHGLRGVCVSQDAACTPIG